MIVGILSALGLWAGDEGTGFIMGFIGVVVTIILLVVLSVKASVNEDQVAKRFNTPEE